MPTTFTLNSTVVEAMLQFAAGSRDQPYQAVMCDILCEVSHDAVRLVATDTHVLGILHLSLTSGYDLEITGETPCQIILPVSACRALLKTAPAVTLIVSEATLVVVAGEMQITLPVRPGSEFPNYRRLLPETLHACPRTALDTALLAKFTAFAKALKYAPHLDISFHTSDGPVSIRIAGFSSFYGMLAPRHVAFESALPDWLQADGQSVTTESNTPECIPA